MGHVPGALIDDIKVLTFREAQEHSPISTEYDRDKWMYIPNFYAEYRYILGTVGGKPLITIGINPSTAAPNDLDNTLKSVERIALGNGFDSFIMLNVYARRATDPNHMEKTMNQALHEANMDAFRWALGRCGAEPTVWAAWGTVIQKRGYLLDCLRDMIDIGEQFGARWVCAGNRSVKGGHPHHPLYLRKDSKLVPFQIDEYVDANR